MVTGVFEIYRAGKGEYRFSASINAQPTRADLLLNEDAIASGFPGRFLFVSTEDPEIADIVDHTPSVVYKFTRPRHVDGRHVAALPEMDAAHRAMRRSQVRGEHNAMDSHVLLTRAIITVAFADMSGRDYLISEDWELSGFVMAHSAQTRDKVLSAMTAAATARERKEGKRMGIRSVWAKATEADLSAEADEEDAALLEKYDSFLVETNGDHTAAVRRFDGPLQARVRRLVKERKKGA